MGAIPIVRIVSPGTRAANNGNWRTAARWAAMLRDCCRPIVQTQWKGERADAMIALHAVRSADSIRAFRASHPEAGLAVVLTGTDLYRDIARDPSAGDVLALADRIVVLQEDALDHVPQSLRDRCVVLYRSATTLKPRPKAAGRLNAVAVGHLREEKDPETLFRAMALLPAGMPVRLLHVGAALDRQLGRKARDLARRDPRYRWTGTLPHGLARAAMSRAHVLVHPSRLEGGANVIAEALASGTPVIASRMSGNVGMLGANFPGYFEVGDAKALAGLLRRCLEDPGFLKALRATCSRRAALFRPRMESRALHALVASLLP